MLSKEEISRKFLNLQKDICRSLEIADGSGKFNRDEWKREEGGGGITRLLKEGSVIEKGGVLFSAVHGPVPPFIHQENSILKNENFYATGISIVIHPYNPLLPIIHMNVRYFEMTNGSWWFGGGIDLTPHYIVKEDAAFFHSALKDVCDRFSKDYYLKFKNWADDYFFIPHRQETRGVGGIFFDKLTGKESSDKEKIFEFVTALAESFAPVYTALIKRNKDLPFSEREKQWQLLRRGRYVEFNLVYDKGTRFGLETNGRTESILMSLPKLASWEYDFKVEAGSKEEKTLALLKKGLEWYR